MIRESNERATSVHPTQAEGVQDLRVEDAVSQALQQAQEADGQMTGKAEEAAGTVTGDLDK